jgi:hypothetical protein
MLCYKGFGLYRISLYLGFGLYRVRLYLGFGINRFHCINIELMGTIDGHLLMGTIDGALLMGTIDGHYCLRKSNQNVDFCFTLNFP